MAYNDSKNCAGRVVNEITESEKSNKHIRLTITKISKKLFQSPKHGPLLLVCKTYSLEPQFFIILTGNVISGLKLMFQHCNE